MAEENSQKEKPAPLRPAPVRPPVLTLQTFFEKHPPGSPACVSVNLRPKPRDSRVMIIELPDLQLHCASDHCQGMRFFRSSTEWQADETMDYYLFVHYTCRNCGTGQKTYALELVNFGFDDTFDKPVQLRKFGESPPFGSYVPPQVSSLIGSERDYYFKGLRAESQSMGIAAFAYYRRVVENKKAAIFDQIIRVSDLLNAEPALLEELRLAKDEQQFTKAVELVKHAIPQALMIQGHNPLTLLHSALSEGLHGHSDAECLELAASIRAVLHELVERVANALKDEKELSQAVAKLLKVKRDKT